MSRASSAWGDLDTIMLAVAVFLLVRACDRADFNKQATLSGKVLRVDQDGEPLCYEDEGREACWD